MGVKNELLHLGDIEEEVTICAPLAEVGNTLWAKSGLTTGKVALSASFLREFGIRR